jgi:hypothetical protein
VTSVELQESAAELQALRQAVAAVQGDLREREAEHEGGMAVLAPWAAEQHQALTALQQQEREWTEHHRELHRRDAERCKYVAQLMCVNFQLRQALKECEALRRRVCTCTCAAVPCRQVKCACCLVRAARQHIGRHQRLVRAAPACSFCSSDRRRRRHSRRSCCYHLRYCCCRTDSAVAVSRLCYGRWRWGWRGCSGGHRGADAGAAAALLSSISKLTGVDDCDGFNRRALKQQYEVHHQQQHHHLRAASAMERRRQRQQRMQ